MVKYNKIWLNVIYKLCFSGNTSYMHKQYMLLFSFYWIYMKSSKNVIVCNRPTDIK